MIETHDQEICALEQRIDELETQCAVIASDYAESEAENKRLRDNIGLAVYALETLDKLKQARIECLRAELERVVNCPGVYPDNPCKVIAREALAALEKGDE